MKTELESTFIYYDNGQKKEETLLTDSYKLTQSWYENGQKRSIKTYGMKKEILLKHNNWKNLYRLYN